MLQIRCPYCGLRPEVELRYAGDAHVARPEDPSQLDDAAWADFVYMKRNVKGIHRERWQHSLGCRRFFNVARDTVAYEILASYKTGETPPDLPERKEV